MPRGKFVFCDIGLNMQVWDQDAALKLWSAVTDGDFGKQNQDQ